MEKLDAYIFSICLRRASTKGALAVLAGICVSLQVSVKACNNFGGTAKSRFDVVTVVTNSW